MIKKVVAITQYVRKDRVLITTIEPTLMLVQLTKKVKTTLTRLTFTAV